MNKIEIEKIVDELKAAGWTVTLHDHYRCVPPDKTKPIVYLSQTPSDYRGLKNMKAKIRKSDYPIK